MKIRLVTTFQCPRSCEGCCNKQIDWEDVPKFSLTEIPDICDTIILTGGEPLVNPLMLRQQIKAIRHIAPDMKFILYTALPSYKAIKEVAEYLDGITFTIHETGDVPSFVWFTRLLEVKELLKTIPSKRVNVFKPASLEEFREGLEGWDIREGYEWIEDCPVPENEILMRGPLL